VGSGFSRIGRVAAFAQELMGWTEGRNLRIDFRGAGANPDDSRK